ncbi:MAG: hypothetical protein JWM11_7700 [Planctomycetaceae bacterium]|nr:hypothetical protein [Planctomycetaceae bacterium]
MPVGCYVKNVVWNGFTLDLLVLCFGELDSSEIASAPTGPVHYVPHVKTGLSAQA